MPDPHKSTAANGASPSMARVAFGSVVNVRPISSRAVTRIEIEIPIEAHIEATSLLYGKDVLIVPMTLPPTVPYGMADGAIPDVAEPGAAAHAASPEAPVSASSERTSAASPFSALAGGKGRSSTTTPRASGTRSPMLGRREDAIDIVRWLGIRCNDKDFRGWLGVSDEAAAAHRVRELCGVTSRKEISGSLPARRAFFEQIYKPFIAHVAQSNGITVEDMET